MSVAGLKTTVFPQTSAGSDLPARDRDREVPRRDHADDSDRLADAHVELVAELRRRRLAEQAPALAGHVVGHVDRFLDVAARLGQHLAHLARHQLREVLLLLGQEVARSGRGSRRASAPGRGASPRRPPSRRRRRGRRPRRVDRGKTPIASPFAGLVLSKVSPDGGVDPLAGDVVLECLCAEDAPRRAILSSAASVSRNVPGIRGRRRSRSLALAAGSPAVPAAVGPLAAVDDDRHVRVVLVVLDHLVEELGLELTRDHAIDHAPRIVGSAFRWLEASDLWHDASVRLDPRVPGPERRLELLELVARAPPAGRAAPSRSRTRYWYQEMSQATVTTTSVFTPESGTTLACGLPRLLPIPPTVRRYGLALKSRPPRPSRARARRAGAGSAPARRVVRGGAARVEERAEAERRLRRARPSNVGVVGLPSLSQPCSAAMLLAERADVEEVLAVRGEARRPLADEQRPLADRARLRGDGVVMRASVGDYSPLASRLPRAASVSLCVFYTVTRSERCA